jgi:hypothetical protein
LGGALLSVFPERGDRFPFAYGWEGSHSSIQLSSHPHHFLVCKTMERMVNDRLVFLLEKENLLAPAQCGFRRHRSAVDHLISLEHQIQNCFVLRQQLVTVFFDLENSYDTTWRFWYTSCAPRMEVPRPPETNFLNISMEQSPS